MFHSLPKSGGLLEQDAYHVFGMKFVLEAQAERRAKEQGQRSSPSGVR